MATEERSGLLSICGASALLLTTVSLGCGCVMDSRREDVNVSVDAAAHHAGVRIRMDQQHVGREQGGASGRHSGRSQLLLQREVATRTEGKEAR